MPKPLSKLTARQLRRIERSSQDSDRAIEAGEELAARRRFSEEQDDTPFIEWNGFDRPGDY